MALKELTISYQGVRGAYSHLSCKNYFKDSTTIACDSFLEAMQFVEEGKSDYAMIPLENSTAGRVEEIYRLIPQLKLFIVGEHFEPVKHCLLGIKGSCLEDIKEVSSHPQALAQCHNNILKLGIRARASFDTAGSAKKVQELACKEKAAIASSLAAKLYDLEVLDDSFGDLEGNTTRFIVLSKKQERPVFKTESYYITSLVFEVRNIPAALYKALGGFATNGVNLIKLESYSMPGSLQCSQFHVDIDGHPDEKRLQLALEELEFFAKDIKFLGVYQKNECRI